MNSIIPTDPWFSIAILFFLLWAGMVWCWDKRCQEINELKKELNLNKDKGGRNK